MAQPKRDLSNGADSARQGIDWTTRIIKLAGVALVFLDALTDPPGTDAKTLAIAAVMLAGAQGVDSIAKHLIDRVFEK